MTSRLGRENIGNLFYSVVITYTKVLCIYRMQACREVLRFGSTPCSALNCLPSTPPPPPTLHPLPTLDLFVFLIRNRIHVQQGTGRRQDLSLSYQSRMCGQKAKTLYTVNNFPFMYSQKRISQVSLLIPTKYFQNSALPGIMIFCRGVRTSSSQL
jgi:hypothetical protein